VPVSKFITQIADILDYHTVVGDINDGNEYYLTKNGAAIHVSKAGGLTAGEKIYGGQALERGGGSTIAKIHNEKNGHAYVIDSLLQGPTRSVYSIMKSRSIDSEFFNLLQADETCMNWVGISSETTTGGKSEADKYNICVLNNGLDYNVNLFDSYNYTVYVPDNDAMRAAYALGLPTWDDVRAIYNDYVGDNASEHSEEEEQAAKAKAMAMIDEINNFVRYHFQDNSVFVDHTVTSKDYSTSSLNANTGRYLSLSVSGGSDQLRVKDNHGVTITINKNDGVHNTNVMARDFVFNTARATATAISTSSFAVIHEIGKVLDYHPASYGDRYDNAWK
jgi:ribosomal protein L31E